MRIVFESYFYYWCILFCYCTFLLGGFLDYARNDSSPATAGSYVFVCCVWITRLRLGGPSISLTPHLGRQHTSVCRRLCFCLLCIGCTSTIMRSFDYAQDDTGGVASSIMGFFDYAQVDS